MNIYEEKGYKDRDDYLTELCLHYDSEIVIPLSELYGPSEDFDGLLTSLEDYDI